MNAVEPFDFAESERLARREAFWLFLAGLVLFGGLWALGWALLF